MVEAFLGGLVIGLGCIANYTVGGWLGALFFAITILSAVYYDLDIFVGKAGLLTNKNLDIVEMLLVFAGNFAGITWISLLIKLIPQYGEPLGKIAEDMLTQTSSVAWDTCFVLAIFAGMTLYGGIVAYVKTKNWIMLVLPIMMMILADWPFSLITVFLLWQADWINWPHLIPIILGNMIGVNIWHLLRRRSERYHDEFKPDASDISSKFHDFVLSTKNHANNDNSSHK